MVEIRDYRAETDAAGVRACLVELQDHERALEPALVAGDAMADAHLAHLLDVCRMRDGGLLVALDAGRVVGVACVWARVPPSGPDDVPVDYAFLSDLVVLESHRGQGIGGALLARVETFAKERGASALRVGVRRRNLGARQLYADAGFVEDRLELVKPL